MPAPTTTDQPPDAGQSLRFAAIADPNMAIGLAVRLMIDEPAFAKLTFGDWAQVLNGQVQRGHYGFVLDETDKVVGFMGWALATQDKADAWADGAKLTDEECRAGDCLIINAWVEKSPAVHRFMIDEVRTLMVGRALAYFRRIHMDGTSRVVRMPIDEIVSGRPRGANAPAIDAGEPSTFANPV